MRHTELTAFLLIEESKNGYRIACTCQTEDLRVKCTVEAEYAAFA